MKVTAKPHPKRGTIRLEIQLDPKGATYSTRELFRADALELARQLIQAADTLCGFYGIAPFEPDDAIMQALEEENNAD